MKPVAANEVCAVILAGGEGRRLGGMDKALMLLHGRPMLAHAIDRLAGQVKGCALSAAGDPARFAGFGLAVLDDGRHRGKGPLAGVLAGMRWAAAAGAGALLSLPVDTPFAPRDLVSRLGGIKTAAAWHGRVHHLVALWPVAAADLLEDFLDTAGSRRVGDFGRTIGMQTVAFDGDEDPFLNVNTEADRAAAEARRC